MPKPQQLPAKIPALGNPPCKNRAKVFAPSLPTPKNMKTFDGQKLSK